MKGTAADAIVGAQLCVGILGMYHSGLGGGGFLLIRDSHGNYESVDYRESAPAAAFEEMYHDNFIGSLIGGLAAGVPGELRGLEYLHHKYGVSRMNFKYQPYTNSSEGPPLEQGYRAICQSSKGWLH